MGPMNDAVKDDGMVTAPAATTPAGSDFPADPRAAGAAGDTGDNAEDADEPAGVSGMEETGYGYGV